ncbi:hypothetical protein SVIOM74S_06853 [Streptomyces violarus]
MQNAGQLSRRQILAAAGFIGLATLTGCGSGDDGGDGKDLSKKQNGAMKNYRAGQQFKAAKPLSFSVLHNNNPVYPMKDGWLFWKELTKRTGVTLKPVDVPLADYEKKRSVLIGAGDAPFLIPKTYHPSEVAFVSSGAILPVSDYVHLMPNFRDKVRKWKLEPELDSIRQSDGKYYPLPDCTRRPRRATRCPSARTSHKHGLSLPTTWDEVHDVLKALREEYPRTYPFSDRWSTNTPFPCGALFGYLGQAFGVRAGLGVRQHQLRPQGAEVRLHRRPRHLPPDGRVPAGARRREAHGPRELQPDRRPGRRSCSPRSLRDQRQPPGAGAELPLQPGEASRRSQDRDDLPCPSERPARSSSAAPVWRTASWCPARPSRATASSR